MREHVFYTDGVWRYVVSPASESGSSVIVEVFCGGRLDATMVVGRSHLLLAVMTHIARRLFAQESGWSALRQAWEETR